MTEDYYNNNADFKEYVDKYCTKSNKSVTDALQDAIVLAYLKYLKDRENNL